MSDTEERIALEDIPLAIVTQYHNPEDASPEIRLEPGGTPFILMRMKQVAGMVQCEIDASLIDDDLELIETLEVFLTALVEERAVRVAPEMAEYLNEQEREADRG